MEKVYSNQIWISFIHFLERQFGREVADKVLEECEVDRLQIADLSGFQTQEFGARLTEAAIRLTGWKDISYHAGRAVADSLGKVQGIIIGLASPAMCMRQMGHVESKVARKTISQCEVVGKNLYRVRVSFRDGFKEDQYACQNRIGSYEALPRFFGLPYGKVEHPKCVFRGDDQCEYVVAIPEYRFIAAKHVAVALGAAALGLAMTGIFQGQGFLWSGVGCLVAAMASFSYYKHQQAGRSTEGTMFATQGLSNQNRMLEKDNASMTSLQALTLGLGQSLRVKEICEQIVSALVRDFGYGSSQIWLLDEDGKTLANRAAKGYPDHLMAFITHTRFQMGVDWNNPYGLLIQTLEQGKTLLVNDVEEALAQLTPRTQEFIKALNTSAFIITPLIHDNRPVGILTAEQHGNSKLDNKDRLLFQSISHFAANAVVRAELFEKMEQKIEQRTRELEAANNQLMAAKEMAIQSEKLSSLGQMAAGVAHEINNPLNFLVNIMPEVRRDLEALEKIRILALEGAKDPVVAARIREIDTEADLETHLEEKGFVFERIQKALDKSTRIANSLKVFSRSSTKEKVERVTFAAMLQTVVDLIPQKVKGDTAIELDIPPELDWNVNRNEMEQAFLALINNAIDAMGQKGRVQVKAIQGHSELALAFKDEGPGIPQDALKRIFDPFYTTKPPGKGTGLGLTIASEIVRKYGGALSATSEPGQGATFFIRFRKEAAMELAPKPASASQAA